MLIFIIAIIQYYNEAAVRVSVRYYNIMDYNVTILYS